MSAKKKWPRVVQFKFPRCKMKDGFLALEFIRFKNSSVNVYSSYGEVLTGIRYISKFQAKEIHS